MKKRIVLFCAAITALAVAACDGFPLNVGCAGVGYYAVQVAIRDVQGNPQALNASITLYDGTFTERDSSIYDPLTILGASERGGRTYDILVSKPYYQDVWVRGVKAPGGGCVTGNEKASITVPVVLQLASNAPPVRTVRLLPPRIVLDRPPYRDTATFRTYVDANAGLSRAVFWRITGDTGSVTFDATTGKFNYRCLARSGLIIVSALSVADSTVVGKAELAVQGHTGSGSDLPCSAQ